MYVNICMYVWIYICRYVCVANSYILIKSCPQSYTHTYTLMVAMTPMFAAMTFYRRKKTINVPFFVNYIFLMNMHNTEYKNLNLNANLLYHLPRLMFITVGENAYLATLLEYI